MPRNYFGARYCNQFVHSVHNVMNSCEFAPTINSRRQMAGSPPNQTMDSRSACIQGVLKVKVKGHVIRALLCWQENSFFTHANDRIKASSLQSNISSISVTIARWKHHCGRSLLSTIALLHLNVGLLCDGVASLPVSNFSIGLILMNALNISFSLLRKSLLQLYCVLIKCPILTLCFAYNCDIISTDFHNSCHTYITRNLISTQ